MIKVLELIQTELRMIYPKVYRDQVPPKTKTPYVVWSIPNMADLTEKEEWDLQITVFDYDDDADQAWVLAERIDAGLWRRNHVVDDGRLVRFLKQNRRPIPDPDPKLQRIEVNYIARVYDGNWRFDPANFLVDRLEV